MSDLRHAWRSIVRMPVLASVVVVSLGVGIGVNTAVFSWIQAVVLRPLPGVRDAGGMRLLEPRTETGSYPGMSWLEYGDLRGRQPARRPAQTVAGAAPKAVSPGVRLLDDGLRDRGRARGEAREAR